MIILSEPGREDASELSSIASLDEPLPERTRRAMAAAAAVERGEVDLEQATKRYGIAAALIEAWQHTLNLLRPGKRESGAMPAER